MWCLLYIRNPKYKAKMLLSCYPWWVFRIPRHCFPLVRVHAVSLQSRDRIGTGGPVVDCSRLFDNDLPDGYVTVAEAIYALALQHCVIFFVLLQKKVQIFCLMAKLLITCMFNWARVCGADGRRGEPRLVGFSTWTTSHAAHSGRDQPGEGPDMFFLQVIGIQGFLYLFN